MHCGTLRVMSGRGYIMPRPERRSPSLERRGYCDDSGGAGSRPLGPLAGGGLSDSGPGVSFRPVRRDAAGCRSGLSIRYLGGAEWDASGYSGVGGCRHVF